MNHHLHPIEVGKYRVSPVATQLDDGGFAASVSIRSGKGSATHDRVSRFSTLFDNAPAALHYATAHAMAWIGERNTAAICHPLAAALGFFGVLALERLL